MRKLYNEFFYIPKHGKIHEKVMLTRVAMTIAIMVVSLVAMTITAYACFSYNVTSGSNIIKTANFEINVQVQIVDSDGNAADIITPITSNYKSHKVEGMKVGEYYTVTITPTDNNTAKTGFVVVTAEGCNDTYHTQQLGVDERVEGGKTEKITFKLMITEQTDVILRTHWGTSARSKGENEDLYITQGEEIKMIVNGVVEPSTNTENKAEGATTNTEPTTDTNSSSTPTTDTTTPAETTPSETTGTSEPTTTTEPSGTVTETTPQTTEPETTETTSTKATTETQPATETTETTGATTTEANE